jgi:hypothetical protein
MVDKDGLLAIDMISKFKKNFQELFILHLGPEGPALGGPKRQWTDWYALMLLFYSTWNAAMLKGDFKLLIGIPWNNLKSETITLLSKGAHNRDDPPILSLADAMNLADHQCPQHGCCSARVACDELCFQCNRFPGLEKTSSGPNPFQEWYSKLSEDDKKLSKAEKDKKFKAESGKRISNSAAGSTIKSMATYTERAALRQDLIGPPQNMVGAPPRSLVLKHT